MHTITEQLLNEAARYEQQELYRLATKVYKEVLEIDHANAQAKRRLFRLRRKNMIPGVKRINIAINCLKIAISVLVIAGVLYFLLRN